MINKWWPIFALVNIFLITCTIAQYYLPDFPLKWRLITPFSLHGENSIAVWWSGMTILLAALLFLNRFKQSQASNRTSWLAVSAIMTILSIDEIGSIHERVGLIFGWAGIFPFAIILAGLLIYAILDLLKFEDTRVNAILIIIAFSIYGSVALQEFIEHSYQWKAWMLGIRTGIEEGSELLATFLLLYAAIRKDTVKEKPSILSIIPNQNTLSSLKSFAALGLIIHVIGSYLVVVFIDLSQRGNPMNWYPTALFFCIALICFSKMINLSGHFSSKKWGLLGALSLITSIGIMSNLFIMILPGINKFIDVAYITEHYILIYFIQLIILGVLLTKKMQITPTVAISSFIFIFVLIWLDLYIEKTWLRYSMLGALSYWVFYIFTSRPTSKDQS